MDLGLKIHSSRVALELIDVQDSSFGLQLEAVVDDVLGKISDHTFATYKELMDSSYIKDIEVMIFKRTGLRIQLVVNEDIAAILSFFTNKHSILINPIWRGEFTIKDQQAILDRSHDRKGTIDLKKGRVGGLFSEYRNILFINFHVLVNHHKLSTREIVAIILHEMGHAFYNCEYSDRLESTNQILANVAREMLSDATDKKLEYIYRELKSIDAKVTEQQVDEIVNGNRIIAGYHLFKITVNSVLGQMSDATYDKTSFEQLADHFATRFGYGKDLIIALDKLHDYFNNPEKSQSYNTFNTILTSIGAMATMMMLFAAIIGGVTIVAVYLSFFIGIVLYGTREDVRDYTYDKLKIRYKRIRNTYIDVIRKAGLSNDELRVVIENIYIVDGIIANTYIATNIYNKLANMLFSKARKADDHIREQQLLEELAFNDLFISAAAIKLTDPKPKT